MQLLVNNYLDLSVKKTYIRPGTYPQSQLGYTCLLADPTLIL